MIYHISGCDCTVKSTLCNKLGEKLNLDVVHFDKPKNMEDGKKQYFDFLKNLDKDIICDRFHDGEYIYAPLYRGYEANYLEEFETQLRKQPYLFINTYSDIDKIIERAEKRGEDFVKFDDFKKVSQLFEDYIRKQNMPYITLDTTKSTEENELIDNAVDYILKCDKIIKELFENNKDNDIYFGCLGARYIIEASDYETLLLRKQKMINNNAGITYRQCWFTTTNNKEFLLLQKRLIGSIR